MKACQRLLVLLWGLAAAWNVRALAINVDADLVLQLTKTPEDSPCFAQALAALNTTRAFIQGEDLTSSSPAHRALWQLFNTQQELMGRLDTHLKAERGVLAMEGHTGTWPVQQLVYLALASMVDCVRHVCEIGFNAGHSATVWLSAKPSLQLTAWDLGAHNYTPWARDYLLREAPGRLTLHIGSSMHAIPQAVASRSVKPCDLLVVDGGHEFDEAMADLINMRQLASPDFNLLITDDAGCKYYWCAGPTAALEVAYVQRLVRHLKTYRAAQQVRGFSVGYYIFPPRLTDAYLYGKKFGRGKAGSGPGRGSGSGGRLRGGADTSGGQSDEGKTREGNTREGKAREGKRGFWGRWWR